MPFRHWACMYSTDIHVGKTTQAHKIKLKSPMSHTQKRVSIQVPWGEWREQWSGGAQEICGTGNVLFPFRGGVKQEQSFLDGLLQCMLTTCVFPLCTAYHVHLLRTFSLSAGGEIEPRACTCLVSALLLSGPLSPHKVLMKVLRHSFLGACVMWHCLGVRKPRFVVLICRG